MEDLEARFKAIVLRLWGDEEGEEIYRWIVDSRPPYFHGMIVQVMVPMWEMNKVDLKTKILAMCACFTARHMQEVEFMFKAAAHHGIPREQVEEIVLLAGPRRRLSLSRDGNHAADQSLRGTRREKRLAQKICD